MSKSYKVSFFQIFWECEIVIDPDKIIDHLSTPDKPYTALDAMREQVLFFAGGKEQLKYNIGDVVKTYAQQLARQILMLVIENEYSLDEVCDKIKEIEGWLPIDASWGVELVDMDQYDFDAVMFDVEEVTNG